MPKIEFIPDNVVQTGDSFPKLKLDAGESARVVVLEAPTYVYVHTLRAPEIGTDGKAVWTKAERKGEMVDVIKMGFVGRHQCTGDYNTLSEGRGVDPDNCLMCAASVKTSIVGAPDRRFAAHVAKYATKPGTFDVSKPFSAQIQVWAFTEGIFTKLTQFQKEWGSLLKHDLKLGPCTNKDYQKFDINIAGNAEWLATDNTKQYIAEALEENKCEDLETFIARRKDTKWIEQDLKTVEDRWKVANGAESDPKPAQEALTQDLSNLLGRPKAQAAPAEEAQAPVTESAAVVTEEKPKARARKATPPPVEAEPVAANDEPEDATPVAEPTPVAQEEEPKVAPKSLSFDELINNI